MKESFSRYTFNCFAFVIVQKILLIKIVTSFSITIIENRGIASNFSATFHLWTHHNVLSHTGHSEWDKRKKECFVISSGEKCAGKCQTPLIFIMLFKKKKLLNSMKGTQSSLFLFFYVGDNHNLIHPSWIWFSFSTRSVCDKICMVFF